MNPARLLKSGRFHPAWLLVGVLPLISITISGRGDDQPGWLLLRLFAGVLSALPLVWLARLASGSKPGSGWRLAKEFRLQLPGAVVAILGTSLLLLAQNQRHYLPEMASLPFWTVAYSGGCCILAATTFGAEFDNRTLSSLISQPISRSRIYGEKFLVLILLELCAAVPVAFGDSARESWDYLHDNSWALWVPPIFAIATGPAIALVCRGTLATAVAILGLPVLIMWLATFLRALVAWCIGSPPKWYDIDFGNPSPFAIGCLSAYMVFCPVWGYRRFARFQSRDSIQSGLAGFGFRLTLPMDLVSRQVLGSSSIGVLIRKELRLQVVPWMVAFLTIGLALLVATIQFGNSKFGQGAAIQDWIDLDIGFFFLFFLSAIICLLAGVTPIAEDRALGTFESQLVLPVSVRRQWIIKLAVAIFTGLLLGVILPMSVAVLLFSKSNKMAPDTEGMVDQAKFFTILGLSWILLGFYTSSFSRNSMKGALAGLAGLGLLVGLLSLSNFLVSFWYDDQTQALLADHQRWKNNALAFSGTWEEWLSISEQRHQTFLAAISMPRLSPQQIILYRLIINLMGTVPLIALWLRFSLGHLRRGIPSRRLLFIETFQWGALALGLFLAGGYALELQWISSSEYRLLDESARWLPKKFAPPTPSKVHPPDP